MEDLIIMSTLKKTLRNSITLLAIIPVILIAILAYVVATNKYTELHKNFLKKQVSDYSDDFSTQLKFTYHSLEDLNDMKNYFSDSANASDTQKHFLIIINDIDDSEIIIVGDDEDHADFIKQLSNIISTMESEKLIPFYDTFMLDQYIYGYRYIPDFACFYVIRQDTQEHIADLVKLRIFMIIFLVFILLVIIYFSSEIVTRYTTPISHFREKLQQILDGDLDVHFEIDSEDEFADVVKGMNHLIEVKKELNSNHKELELNREQIEQIAHTDNLTGIYNRVAFQKYANEILHSKSGFTHHAVICIDLDNFKNINNTLGHNIGDNLLKQIASKFSSLINEDDFLARTGGDEFVIFKNIVKDHKELKAFASTLVSISESPFILNEEKLYVSVSVGIALFPDNGLSLTELMKNADIAMYVAKNTGKNNYIFYNSIMDDELNRHNDLIGILKQAIENKDVYLLYQPQANIATGEITGCEALMRLNSPIVGFVSPDEFIPVAEENGLIDDLGEWALVEACQFNQRLMALGYKPIMISVNISTIQLRGTKLLSIIKNLHSQTNMPLEYLEIELTESILMKNFEHHLSIINQIKELGVQVALDDFGTGYSSFNYLTKLPIDTLKIDKSFIASICENDNDLYIAGTIIELAHKLGISVVAEGVETIDQLRVLQTQMCDKLQGYFFSRPITEESFIEMLNKNSE